MWGVGGAKFQDNEILNENVIGKRKRTPDQDEEIAMNYEENKKLKVTPQNRNLQNVERKRNTTPKLTKIYRKEKKYHQISKSLCLNLTK